METWLQNLTRIPLGQRLILIVAAAASAAVIAVTVLWAQKPDYEPLFGGLSVQDAGSIVDRLRDAGVQYTVSEGGTTVMVPSTRVHELRMSMAEEGLPSGGGVGFEIFDRTDYGTTNYVQKVNYRRALEGELSRTISSLDQVVSARVHLVLPEKRLFAKDQEAARASVTLKLAGHTMADAKVQGVLHLVASSVEGLDPARVTVIDTSGRVLYAGGDKEGASQLVASQAGYRMQIEERLRERVVDILAPVVGRDKVQVQVAAQLDFTRTETTQELFDPEVSSIRSEQRSKDQSEGSAGTGGVTGVTGATAQAGAGGESNKSKNQTETINYELNKTVSHIVSPVGQIKRLSVAVLVDAAVLQTEGGKPVDLAPYVNLVRKAVGFDAERGDAVDVVPIAFAVPEDIAELPAPGMTDKLMPYAVPAIRYLIALLAVGAVIALVLKPLVKVVSQTPSAPMRATQDLVLAGGLPKTVGELESENSLLFADFEPQAEMPQTRDDVLRMAEDNPRQAAEMLKSWMKDA